MSTVKRTVVINKLEPAPLSLAAPSGMETRIETRFLRQNGAPWDVDLGAQLQLTGRSGGATTIYAMPYIDLVNGKARAVIPSGDLIDLNGYRLRLLGTVDQEPMLLAIGALKLFDAAGIEAVPSDVIDTIDISMTRGFAMQMTVTLWHDAGKTNPYDASSGITAAVYAGQAGAMLVPFTQVLLSYNQLELSLTDLQVNPLPNSCWWTLVAATGAGQTTLAQGNVTVIGVAP